MKTNYLKRAKYKLSKNIQYGYNTTMPATRSLPVNYQLKSTLKLSSFRSAVMLNLAAIPLLFFFGWLFGYVIIIARRFNPFQSGIPGYFSIFSLPELLLLLLSILIMLVIHELIHGFFFWLFTHERPRFALRSGYAFAAAPGWYLPRAQYIPVGLSPFVILTLVSLALASISASPLVPYLHLIAAFNAAGSLGDLIVVAWVLTQPSGVLIKDEGDVFTSFTPHME